MDGYGAGVEMPALATTTSIARTTTATTAAVVIPSPPPPPPTTTTTSAAATTATATRGAPQRAADGPDGDPDADRGYAAPHGGGPGAGDASRTATVRARWRRHIRAIRALRRSCPDGQSCAHGAVPDRSVGAGAHLLPRRDDRRSGVAAAAALSRTPDVRTCVATQPVLSLPLVAIRIGIYRCCCRCCGQRHSITTSSASCIRVADIAVAACECPTLAGTDSSPSRGGADSVARCTRDTGDRRSRRCGCSSAATAARAC